MSELRQVIAPDGTSRVAREDIALSDSEMHEMLRLMMLARRLDEECVKLHAEGEMAVYPPCAGQEAAQVGSAFALAPDDFIFPSFREFAAALTRGVDAVTYLSYHRGTWHGGPWDVMEKHFAPICVPLATQIPHAVGYAMGMNLRGDPTATLAYFGDGAASEGDFHEACNFAAVFQAPVVLFCQNNGWAISVPFAEQAAAPIVDRAAGYGIPGVRVDGNDVVAVWQATEEAAERARRGEGPTLIEAMTFRMGPHLTNDEPGRYRTDEEVERWRGLDPIDRFRRYLAGTGIVTADEASALEEEAETAAERVRAGLIATPAPEASDIFEMAYHAMPRELMHQQVLMDPVQESDDD
ncbi:MAG: pyruvate dehydrogenase (acetyl-transferring) E1 component subunit alpha [Actinobacteria bacterium]|nr:pyruvate dehydrogenase (acetyl-transferring) E1 component subunit alpha [Actinomycetota bacterium]